MRVYDWDAMTWIEVDVIDVTSPAATHTLLPSEGRDQRHAPPLLSEAPGVVGVSVQAVRAKAQKGQDWGGKAYGKCTACGKTVRRRRQRCSACIAAGQRTPTAPSKVKKVWKACWCGRRFWSEQYRNLAHCERHRKAKVAA